MIENVDKLRKSRSGERSDDAGRKRCRRARWLATARSSQGRLEMVHPSTIGVITRSLTPPSMALGIALAVALAATTAQAFDDTKNPDWAGQWRRAPGVSIQWDPTKPLGRGQQAPLTPEYQALFEAS